MVVTPDIKMADLILHDIQLLALIQRFKIPLGFREKNVREICIENGVDVNFFIHLAKACHDKDYFPQDEFIQFPAEWIVKYLQNSHRSFIDNRIPAIEKLLVELEDDLEKQKNAELLLKFFREYIREFHTHIELEERIVFPYTLMTAQCIAQQGLTDAFKERFSNFSIDRYVEDHNDIEEKLFDLKNILIKYMPTPTDSFKYNNLIFELFRLENDLHDHSDLEDKVLIPKVRLMEKELKRIIKDKK